jgi:hypothetical protein
MEVQGVLYGNFHVNCQLPKPNHFHFQVPTPNNVRRLPVGVGSGWWMDVGS